MKQLFFDHWKLILLFAELSALVIVDFCAKCAPVGYEDETGFHYGVK